MKRSQILWILVIICLLAFAASQTLFLKETTKQQGSNLQNIGEEYFAGPFKVQAVIDPQQPRVGNNQLNIIIRDKNDQPIDNANIKAVAEMPAMGSMPTMYAPAEITNTQPGLYQGQFELPMMGAWPLTLTIDAGVQGQAQISFDMGTSRKGLAFSTATPSTFAAQSNNQPNSALQAKTFKVDSYRRQLIGVTTDIVTCINMTKTIHANAQVNYDQTRLSDINLKFAGWIDKLNTDYVGKQIKKGQTLFSVYSPELISGQDEYLYSIKRSQTGQDNLKAVAARRLSLWGINRTQIRALAKRGRPLEYLPILSPISGTIIEKNIVAGSAFKAGEKLLRIADLSTVWVEGQVYESDLPWVELGMNAEVTLANQPDTTYTGTVTFIEPFLNNKTRTARIRVKLANPDGLLRPKQYVHLQLQVALGRRIVVPEQAVVFTGENRVVFVDLGDGRLQAQKITTGVRNDDFIEVIDGLNYGDTIITSGNFLIAAESKLKSGVDQW
ncbi:MAG: membrane fusion protein, Cu(I)/Ag(I) efflux system [Methyloprofundus sp.]|nr:MAG: membrane fusion protein, Cu(I)/Ag(I) efflux system [Methyloprofundus sp.]